MYIVRSLPGETRSATYHHVFCNNKYIHQSKLVENDAYGEICHWYKCILGFIRSTKWWEREWNATNVREAINGRKKHGIPIYAVPSSFLRWPEEGYEHEHEHEKSCSVAQYGGVVARHECVWLGHLSRHKATKMPWNCTRPVKSSNHGRYYKDYRTSFSTLSTTTCLVYWIDKKDAVDHYYKFITRMFDLLTCSMPPYPIIFLGGYYAPAHPLLENLWPRLQKLVYHTCILFKKTP